VTGRNQNGLGGVKVMVIDDSKTIRHTAETLLKNAGCKVVTATDGFEALVRIVDHEPDIIFVVILSVRNEASDREWGLRQGAREYLTKPCRAQELIAAVKRNVGPMS
jgi:twitching motility two-component system response regulator PilG